MTMEEIGMVCGYGAPYIHKIINSYRKKGYVINKGEGVEFVGLEK